MHSLIEFGLLVLRNAVHFSNLQEIIGESVVAGLHGEGRLRRLCWTNVDLSDLEIVIHRKPFKTYEIIRHQCHSVGFTPST
jgi:hypothetical protein